MTTKRKITIGASALAIIAIGAPVLAWFAHTPRALIGVCVLISVLGWCAAYLVRLFYIERLAQLSALLGGEHRTGDVLVDVSNQIRNLGRYYRSGYAVQLNHTIAPEELGDNLRLIANVAREELRAQSVELSLFEESTGLWSKSYLSGTPLALEAQSLFDEGTLAVTETKVIRSAVGAILVAPIRFAGTIFGVIRAELQRGVEPDEGDINVIRLLAIQAAVTLLNARFSEELVKMRRLGEESIKAKTGFLATLSHEIRGPLGIILNGTELTLDGLCGPIPEKARDTLGMIKASGEHLLDLVNDVLDYAKVEAGKIVPKPVELGAKELLEDLMNVVRAQAEVKKHRLKLEPVDPTLGILCDKRHSRQMFINFLTNAIKYTPDGGTITVKAERIKPNRIKISITDTGVGIPADQRDRVFAPFERVNHQYSQAQKGTGLGMPLTKRLAEANGGTVDFESVEGQGTTFWLVLPSADIHVAGAEAKKIAAHDAAPIAVGRGEAIMLVDHNDGARQMMETYLNHQGFVVHSAACGRDVIKVLRNTNITSAIIENDLPDLSGEDLVAALRAHPRAAQIPVVLLSANAFVFDIERFLKLGVDRCLSKPVDLREVALTLRRLIDESVGVVSAPETPRVVH